MALFRLSSSVPCVPNTHPTPGELGWAAAKLGPPPVSGDGCCEGKEVDDGVYWCFGRHRNFPAGVNMLAITSGD